MTKRRDCIVNPVDLNAQRAELKDKLSQQTEARKQLIARAKAKAKAITEAKKSGIACERRLK